MTSLAERFEKREPLLVDGAMGTLLLERGLQLGECPEWMNVSQPDVVAEIARLYLDAGADILETNTFGASPMKLGSYGLESRTEEINKAAVNAVRKVTGSGAYVAGCCGPCGRLLKPHGDADPQEVFAGFRRQIACLIEAGVDVICIETMTDLTEARMAVDAARDVAPTIPVTVSMTFDETPGGFYTMMGVSIPEAAAGLLRAGADVIGSNCGIGIESMIGVAKAFRACTDRPLIIQSNAGLPQLKGGVVTYTESPEFTAERAQQLLQVGVTVIGGCCGTTPDHIRALRATIDAAIGTRVVP